MKWISVEDSFPEQADWYVVAAKNEMPGGSKVVTTIAFLDVDVDTGLHLWLAHNDTESDEWNGVTHWMPLPEPPINPKSITARVQS